MCTIKRYRCKVGWANKQIDYVEVEDGCLIKVVGFNGESLPISQAWTNDAAALAIEQGIWIEVS